MGNQPTADPFPEREALLAILFPDGVPVNRQCDSDIIDWLAHAASIVSAARRPDHCRHGLIASLSDRERRPLCRIADRPRAPS